ncbi:hypothetical protein B0H34DRAFT_297920 [Crassisporium funariophilum]|nr:hypothetical protein B0H34DRAFT_297920 [Crassisporium funariophilum]
MASVTAISRICRRTQCVSSFRSKRLYHNTAARSAISNFQMPAMSPTMTEGGIASWKKKEGEAFATGDVLLEIETDKATIDVEAQDDGIMGKILAPDGTKNIPVGKTIALLAEEGDDISNLEAPKEDAAPPQPKEESSSSSTSSPPTPNKESLYKSDSQPPQASQSQSHGPPEHSRPLFPSVHRLLLENNITKPEEIKGTGVRGMLTKGDILAFLGKASGPLGTYKPGPTPIEEAAKAAGKKQTEVVQPLDGATIRRLIVSSMLQASLKARNSTIADPQKANFDSIISDYLPSSANSIRKVPSPSPPPTIKKSAGYLDGLY